TVDLPEPFGPRNPKIDSLPTLNVTWSTAVNVPKRLVKPSHSIIALIVDLALLHVWKINVRCHARAETIIVVRQANFHAKDLTNSVFDRLHVARRELRLSIHLLDDARKIFARKRIDPDAGLIANLNVTEPRFGN